MDGLSAPVVLHAPLPASRTVSKFLISAGGVAVFLSDLGQDEVFELGGPVVEFEKANASLPVGGAVQTDFVALDDGTLYRADQEENDVFELFLDQ